MTAEIRQVVIVGAGLAGLTAARRLHDSGVDVLVVDKGRSVGGRLATRRIGDARLDHGAQFFTVRGDDFAGLVERARGAGVVYEWCRGFDEPPDGHPRYAATGGMTGLAKWLATGIDVRVGCELGSISTQGDRWRLTAVDGTAWEASAAIVTPPLPQSLALLDRGDVALAAPDRARLDGIAYFSTLALLTTMDARPAVPPPGAVQLPETECFTFVADNQQKGVSDVPAVTLHANHQYSASRYDDDPDEVLDELLELARPWFGNAGVVDAQLKKWRYAGPVVPLPEATLAATVGGCALAFAGDALGGPKVEGAFNSGLAAAGEIMGVVA